MSRLIQNMTPRDAIKYLIILLVILASLKLYTIFIPYGGYRYIIFIGAMFIAFMLLINVIYDNTGGFPQKSKKLVLWFSIPILISFLTSQFFHNQSYMVSLIAQGSVYYFFFYFLLHKIKPNPEVLLKLFIGLGYLYCILYLAQYLLYPTRFIYAHSFYDRGTLRIFMPGGEYLFSGYFILLGRYFMTKKIGNLLALIPFLSILVLLGTRQMIAALVLASMINVLLSRTIKSKVLMYFFIALCLIPFYFAFENIFNEMINVSTQQQSEGLTENVRYRAAMYYLFKFNDSKLWMLFGNGMADELSQYGQSLASIAYNKRFYLQDIGLFADLFYYGLIFIVLKLVLYFKLLTWPLLEKYTFIRYNMITILVTIFSGSGTSSAVVALVCMMLYVCDISDVEKGKIAKQSNSLEYES